MQTSKVLLLQYKNKTMEGALATQRKRAQTFGTRFAYKKALCFRNTFVERKQ